MTRQIAVLCASFTISLVAQTAPPVAPPGVPAKEMPAGIFRGTFIASRGTASAGDLTIRATEPPGAGMDLVCHYNAHSYVARDHHRIPVSSLKTGEPLEILADHQPGSYACYASMVRVIDPELEKLAEERARHSKDQNAGYRTLFFTPRGDRAVAGLVVRLTERFLTLRNTTGETTIALRPDTRYVDDGKRAAQADLRVNTHVYVRAGKRIDGVVEAYQVMWGEILNVR